MQIQETMFHAMPEVCFTIHALFRNNEIMQCQPVSNARTDKMLVKAMISSNISMAVQCFNRMYGKVKKVFSYLSKLLGQIGATLTVDQVTKELQM